MSKEINLPKEISQSDLVALSRKLLEAMIKSTKITNGKPMDAKKMKEARVVLGYLNAANRSVQTKMSIFKTIQGLSEKVALIKSMSKKKTKPVIEE